ncbi:MAG: phosphatidylserine decarboxylase [Verrucomicrobiae bacterium]|nr:phosphatidylserine decarboxylase [Verrucomicrobiae bacterium]MCX7721479.1 phosphatidylserine decarboxylase [Verrucomicrobiae bacterium]MDW7979331.1 phosphatidylserine decarboxylase [Verrucomicrobiales bacterium]
MKNAGKARQAGLRLIVRVTIAGCALWLLALGIDLVRVGGRLAGAPVLWPGAAVFCAACLGFAAFSVVFFRDPDPRPPKDARLVVAPAYGTVDLVDETTEPEYMGGGCRRVSIFLSVFDPHVQTAPVTGKVALLKHRPGKYMCALRTESAAANESVLIGFEPRIDPSRRLAMRLVAGVLARRIVPWITPGEEVNCGDRISLIQFGSRVEVYLPLSAQLMVEVGQKVAGGRTVMARLD